MKILLPAIVLLCCSAYLPAQPLTKEEAARLKKQAQTITIFRDQWGIPHVYGKTDADAVFGMIYAQCEDDFERVERNYIGALGRLAEVDGPAYLYEDLRQRMFLDSSEAKRLYTECPEWLKKLMHAWANGINYYLHVHPSVQPRLIRYFQPWMPLLFSEGSIGGDISTVSLKRLEAIYPFPGSGKGNRQKDEGMEIPVPEWRGSNGIAIAPERTAEKKALLLINPHTSFYFRTETHLVSEEGLNVYGAATWGQFFVYQGFNARCGWMHTSSSTDVIDEYAETIVRKNDSLFYQYGNALRPVESRKITIRYKDGDGTKSHDFTTYRTHHGPVTRQEGEKWISVRLMNEPVKALMQSYGRTKAAGYDSFRQQMELKTNSSNNTVYADADGTIAYWQGNFIPKRDTRFNWGQPVDGSNPETEWQGLHALDEIVQYKNPATGWLQNCNSTPYTAAGPHSLDPAKYPSYMGANRENFRAIHAIQLLGDEPAFTLDKLVTAAYDAHLPPFDKLLPALIEACKNVAVTESPRHKLTREAYTELVNWDRRFSESSIAMTLATFWGEKLRHHCYTLLAGKGIPDDPGLIEYMVNQTTDELKVGFLGDILLELEKDFGTWKMPWGDINRFQRLTGRIEETYNDNKPGMAVPFSTGFWGSLATFDTVKPGTKKQYGNGGNSFVAAVEFGKKVRARTIVSGGQSSDPGSAHFNDQAAMYCQGELKEVNFYREDVQKNAKRKYRPGK